MKVKYLIIGAGPTGLGAAYRLKEHGIDNFLIVDADSKVGGLAKSFTDPNGFVWDVGGHIQFSHYAYFDKLMDAAIPTSGWENHERESWVWIQNAFVPYPFQNNLRFLPFVSMVKCVLGLIRQKLSFAKKTKLANFREWIRASFGPGIAQVFMEPYNFKVWATPPEKMSPEWVGERVATISLRRTLGNILFRRDDVSWGPNNRFRFPKRGGTGAIWESVANLVGRDKIRLNCAVVKVAPKLKVLTLADGSEIRYENLLSTMPLDLLVDKCKDLREDFGATASKLQHSSSHIVGIGLKGQVPPHLRGKCWMYFPEDNCPFYRVTVFSHYSKNNVPDPQTQWSLMLEISQSKYRPVDKDKIIEDAIEGLLNTKLIAERADIVSKFYFVAPYGYPIPSVDRNHILHSVQPMLERHNIFSRGRFGGWKYEVSNQDHSVMQGVEWADRMVLGIPEMTYTFPNKANAGKSDLIPVPQIKKAA